MLLLALYLALLPALTALAARHLLERVGRSTLLLVSALWVAAEYLRGVLSAASRGCRSATAR